LKRQNDLARDAVERSRSYGFELTDEGVGGLVPENWPDGKALFIPVQAIGAGQAMQEVPRCIFSEIL
jgi:hypothetical protein